MNKNLKNNENEAQIIKKEDFDQHNSRGIYMRDDHCDWGSSGPFWYFPVIKKRNYWEMLRRAPKVCRL